MAKFVLIFVNFLYHDNRGGPIYISTAPINCWTLKTPVWCKIHRSMSYIYRVMAKFVLKFVNFL